MADKYPKISKEDIQKAIDESEKIDKLINSNQEKKDTSLDNQYKTENEDDFKNLAKDYLDKFDDINNMKDEIEDIKKSISDPLSNLSSIMESLKNDLLKVKSSSETVSFSSEKSTPIATDKNEIAEEKEEKNKKEELKFDKNLEEQILLRQSFENLTAYFVGGEWLSALKDIELLENLEVEVEGGGGGEKKSVFDKMKAKDGKEKKTFLQSLGEGLKYWGQNSLDILKGALTFAGVLLIIGAVVAIMIAVISRLDLVGENINSLVAFGIGMILVAGIMKLLGDTLKNLDTTTIIQGSLKLAVGIMALGVATLALLWLTRLVPDINIQQLLTFGLGLLMFGLMAIILSNVLSKLDTASLLQGAVALAIFGVALIPFALTLLLIGSINLDGLLPKLGVLFLTIISTAVLATVLGYLTPVMAAGVPGAFMIALFGISLIPFVLVLKLLSGLDTEGIIPKLGILYLTILSTAGLAVLLGFLSPILAVGLVGIGLIALFGLGMIPFLLVLKMISGIDTENLPEKFKSLKNVFKEIAAIALMSASIAPIMIMAIPSMLIMSIGLNILSRSLKSIQNLGDIETDSIQSLTSSLNMLKELASSIIGSGINFAAVGLKLAGMSLGLGLLKMALKGFQGSFDSSSFTQFIDKLIELSGVADQLNNLSDSLRNLSNAMLKFGLSMAGMSIATIIGGNPMVKMVTDLSNSAESLKITAESLQKIQTITSEGISAENVDTASIKELGKVAISPKPMGLDTSGIGNFLQGLKGAQQTKSITEANSLNRKDKGEEGKSNNNTVITGGRTVVNNYYNGGPESSQ